MNQENTTGEKEEAVKLTVYVGSQESFDQLMQDMYLDDASVEDVADRQCFISIIGTEECLKYYLHEEETRHWFLAKHPNVCNLEFDDIDKDIVYHGHQFKAMSAEQAEELYRFIKANIGKSFFIHCRAGMSRSQGVAAFILDMFPETYNDNTAETYTCHRDFANKDVIRKLKRAMMEDIYEEKIDFVQEEESKPSMPEIFL